MQHFEDNNILSPRQHGFRSGRSCETQLLEMVEELTETMENGGQTDIVIMDFAKAFDKVNHSLLIHKLEHYGVGGYLNKWIESFLRDRKQAVVVNDTASELVDVRSGVPQGSVLGPCLFLAYINDLPETVNSPTRLFADDTVLYRQINSPMDQQILQEDLAKLENWERAWDMSFHPDKCTALSIISRQRKNKLLSPSYKLHGQNLTNVVEAKYLGVTITQNLKWDTHINNIVRKANQSLGFLRRNLKISSKRLKETAYKAIVRPIIEYANTVWDPYTDDLITLLEAVQRRAARFICSNYHQTASVNEMITSLGWDSLKERRKISRLAMMRKIYHGHVKINFDGKIKPATQRNRRRHNKQLERIPCRRNYRQFSFLPLTIAEWNQQLTAAVVEAETLDMFKSRALGLIHH